MKYYVKCMTKSNIKVLITRPEKQGRVLAQQLQQTGIHSLCQPLFDYQALATAQQTKALLSADPSAIVIFVSVAAVEFAQQSYPSAQWQYRQVIAVGKATQLALKALGVDALSPTLQTSEGLLALPCLADIKDEHIIIVRGDGGRELIAQHLQQGGANVHYLESYQKVWRQLTQKHEQQWQNHQINCIVVTSNASLERIVQLIKNSESYWLDTCLWIVASARIAKHASQLGVRHIINADGANDQAIIAAIALYGKDHD